MTVASDRRITEQRCPARIRRILGTPEGEVALEAWLEGVKRKRTRRARKRARSTGRAAARTARRHARGRCVCGRPSVEGRHQCQPCIDRTWASKAGGLCFGSWRPRDMRFARAFFAGACAYCGGDAACEWDHVVPTSSPSGHGHFVPCNLVPACRPCNRGKMGAELEVWLRSRDDIATGDVLKRLARYQAECRQVTVPPAMIAALAHCNRRR